jgi:hypothetical protein
MPHIIKREREGIKMDDDMAQNRIKRNELNARGIPRTDSYQQMKRAMESFNIEDSLVRFFPTLYTFSLLTMNLRIGNQKSGIYVLCFIA